MATRLEGRKCKCNTAKATSDEAQRAEARSGANKGDMQRARTRDPLTLTFWPCYRCRMHEHA
eukprot:scaffold8633_cov154-Isochrysis_galbana.AAC.6